LAGAGPREAGSRGALSPVRGPKGLGGRSECGEV